MDKRPRNDLSFDSSNNSNNNSNKQLQHTSSLEGAGFCTLCRKPSVCVCHRCGDFYCSPECQRRDWQHHRYICFPMPALVYPPSLTSGSFKEAAGLTLIEAKRFPLQQQHQMPNGYCDSDAQIRTPPTPNSDSHHNRYQQQQQRNSKLQSHVAGAGHLTPPNCPLPAANSPVLLTGFRSPNRCYVRASTPKDDEAYLLFVKKVNACGRTAPPLTMMPKANSFAIAHLDGVMYRVQVISARKSTNIRILLCDSGTIVVRQLSDLREISEEIVRLPQLTVLVQLRNVENYSLNDKLTGFLSQFEDKVFKIRFGEPDERGGNVQLFNWQTERCLNEEIIKFCSESSINVFVDATTRAQLPRENLSCGDKTDSEGPETTVENKIHETKRTEILPEQKKDEAKYEIPAAAPNGHGPLKQIQKPVMIPPFKKTTLEENSVNVKVMVLDNSCLDFGYIGCIAKTNMSYLHSIHKYLKEFQDTDQPYKPKLDEYCIAKFEDYWYRAKVIEIQDDTKYTVVYVDFTNESVVTSADIRRYPSDLTTDCRTNLCLIDGLPSTLTDKHVKFLKQEIESNREFTIDKVKGTEEEIILIECSSLIQKMHDKGIN